MLNTKSIGRGIFKDNLICIEQLLEDRRKRKIEGSSAQKLNKETDTFYAKVIIDLSEILCQKELSEIEQIQCNLITVTAYFLLHRWRIQDLGLGWLRYKKFYIVA
ncbi:hypothetical protein AVEN_64024-1 [Araneus ventricosus]|uniref:Uncharacterized protein n=1 Tax=Araneus ventricosus TaxID=182803 RepID=A0A4Y2SCT0_ARAVE|nr:hypothetical protein AVEN_64024-1 [Araneus ventricosus]